LPQCMGMGMGMDRIMGTGVGIGAGSDVERARPSPRITHIGAGNDHTVLLAAGDSCGGADKGSRGGMDRLFVCGRSDSGRLGLTRNGRKNGFSGSGPSSAAAHATSAVANSESPCSMLAATLDHHNPHPSDRATDHEALCVEVEF
jgi:hypothetical protein